MSRPTVHASLPEGPWVDVQHLFPSLTFVTQAHKALIQRTGNRVHLSVRGLAAADSGSGALYATVGADYHGIGYGIRGSVRNMSTGAYGAVIANSSIGAINVYVPASAGNDLIIECDYPVNG